MRVRHLHLILLASLLAGLVACADAEVGSREFGAAPQRIVLITIDTLRADALLGERPGMPKLAARAARGTSFEDFWASSSTTQPTHASLFTGLHPWEHGVVRNGVVLDAEQLTLAEQLQAAGWSTAAVVASFPLEARFGYAQGFESYADDFRVDTKPEWNGERIETGGFYSLADSVLAETDAALAGADARPQFLWLHLFDPHAPYGDLAGGESLELRALSSASRRADGSIDTALDTARELYDADLAALDTALDTLLTRLERAPGETHLVITSDHGESFGEDGSFGHGKRVTRPQLHVPALVFSPALEPGRRHDTAGSVDLHATLLGLAGLQAPPLARGRDLATSTRGEGAAGMRQSFPPGFLDPRTDGSEVRVDAPRFFYANRGLLLAGDAEAIRAEAGAEDQLPPLAELAPLGERFAAWSAALAAGGRAELSLDSEETRALRALGYVEVDSNDDG